MRSFHPGLRISPALNKAALLKAVSLKAAVLRAALFGAVLSGAALLGASCARGSDVLQDGYYTAEDESFDSHGWKEYVTICVNDGLITTVEFNAMNLSGFIKSWDQDYMRQMNRISGSYPNQYTRFYGKQLLSTQNPRDIDALSGATDSYVSFVQLAEAVIQKARAGDTSVAVIPIIREEAQGE